MAQLGTLLVALTRAGARRRLTDTARQQSAQSRLETRDSHATFAWFEPKRCNRNCHTVDGLSQPVRLSASLAGGCLVSQ